jgi:hypothetical protein
MIYTYNFGTIDFQWWEWIFLPILAISVYFITLMMVRNKTASNPNYVYFKSAFLFKIFGGVFFGLIYVFYYGGGDTTNYYSNTIPLVNLFYENSGDYFRIIFNWDEIESTKGLDYFYYIKNNYFNENTGYPLAMMSGDPKTFAVCKITSLFMIFLGNSYFATTIVIAAVTFIPLWRLFLVFCEEFKGLEKPLSFAILFIPSVIFWGGGMMKDTYTFSATCLAVSSLYYLIKRKKIIWNLFLLLAAFYLIISIKPYVLNVFIPCTGIWLFVIFVKKIKNPTIRILILPLAFGGAIIGSFFVLQSLGSSMDKFSLDNAIQTTQITQDDLKREEQYGSNNFDIGKMDGSISGMISKFPVATFAGLYRPLIVEARSAVMLLSGLENLVLIILTIMVIFKVKWKTMWKVMNQHEILFFCITFSIIFAFMIGITTPNFGALVRFKIPLIPFLAAWLVIMKNYKKIEVR